MVTRNRGFAVNTKVPASQTLTEIQDVLKRYGATHFGYATVPGAVRVGFESMGRRLRFSVPVPDEKKDARGHRQRYRALLLAIKSKLESVASGIETFDEAFMAQVVLPDGRTMSEYATPQIASAYKDGKMPSLLGFDGGAAT